MRDTTERLKDIQDAVSRILKYTSQGRDLFDNDELVQSRVYLQLKNIGEAARSIPKEFRVAHPQISWKRFIDMGDAIVYRYFDINQNGVWTIVENDVPSIKASVEAILTEQW